MASRCHVSLHEAMTAILSLYRRRARGKARDDMTHRHVGSRGPREKQESTLSVLRCLFVIVVVVIVCLNKKK